ncbi:MAG: hypothetical protein DRG33_03385 [Deltaproteobacteria bacterium]|nr:MAG: hypothetical protein DRG33_03385 [Deltaproteobacteria bacterium]
MGRKVFLILALAMLLGCAAHKEEVAWVPSPMVPTPPPEPRGEGSLWIDEGGRNHLFLDNKARWLNDLVTVKIVEVNQAKGEASTESGRESSVDASIDTFFGAPSHFGLKHIWSGGFKPELKAGIESSFEGSGTTSRSMKILATITCRVVQVLPNGNLVIEGRREVKVNREREYIVLSGIVRPEDIAPDNTVLSTAVADARIEYSGSGVISDRQGPGILTRVLDLIWPF